MSDIDGMDDILEDVVAHYGIKGMRWGVRRKGTRGSTPPSSRKPKDPVVATGGFKDRVPKGKRGISKEALNKVMDAARSQRRGAKGGKGKGEDTDPSTSREKFKLDDKTLASLTDQEVSRRVKRIKMEQELADLLKDPPKPKSKARSSVEEVVNGTAVKVGKAALEGASVYAINKAFPQIQIEKHMGGGGGGGGPKPKAAAKEAKAQAASKAAETAASMAKTVGDAYKKHAQAKAETQAAAKAAQKASSQKPRKSSNASTQGKPSSGSKKSSSSKELDLYSPRGSDSAYQTVIMPDGTELRVPKR